MIVEVVVLDRVDEAERQRPTRNFCELEQAGDRVAPAKKYPIAQSLVGAFLWQALGVDDRGPVSDQGRRQALRQRQSLAGVIAEQNIIH